MYQRSRPGHLHTTANSESRNIHLYPHMQRRVKKNSKRRIPSTGSSIITVTTTLLLVGLMGILSMFHKKTMSSAAGFVAGTATTSSNGPRQPSSLSELENRLRGALWGFLAGDALASPTHWYYGGRKQVINDYGHEITGYTKPNMELAGSILNKSDLNGGGRSGGSGSNDSRAVTIIGDVINHGKKDLWSPTKSIHYHATLQAGENTLEVSIARVLMKSIVVNGGTFDADHFRNAYVDFMTTPGSHNDVYASTCHRMFFANMVFRKLPPKDCPDNDSHNVDTQDGLVLPTIVALAGVVNPASATTTTAQAAADCVSVTRRSSVLERTAALWSDVVVSAVRDNGGDSDGDDASGGEASSSFRRALDEFSRQTIRRTPNAQVRDDSTMSACYLSSALPGLVDMVAKYSGGGGGGRGEDAGQRAWQGLLSNANVGGENVHRGSVMGAILGARAGFDRLPPQLVEGLYPRSELEQEIDDFVRAVLQEKK